MNEGQVCLIKPRPFAANEHPLTHTSRLSSLASCCCLDTGVKEKSVFYLHLHKENTQKGRRNINVHAERFFLLSQLLFLSCTLYALDMPLKQCGCCRYSCRCWWCRPTKIVRLVSLVLGSCRNASSYSPRLGKPFWLLELLLETRGKAQQPQIEVFCWSTQKETTCYKCEANWTL